MTKDYDSLTYEELYKEFSREGDEANSRFSEFYREHDRDIVKAMEAWALKDEEHKAMGREYMTFLERNVTSGKGDAGANINWELYYHFKKWREIFLHYPNPLDLEDIEGLQMILDKFSDILLLPRVKKCVGISH